MRDYQESVTTGQTDTETDRQTDTGQSDPYVPLCFAGDTKGMDFTNLIVEITCIPAKMKENISEQFQ